MTIPEAMHLAVQHQQAGRLAEAENLYRQILAVQPNHPDALHMLGVLAHQAQQHGIALELIHRAIALHPGGSAPYHCNLGSVLATLGRQEEAIEAFRIALRLQPEFAEAESNLAAALNVIGRHEEAAAACQRAVTLKPRYAEAWNNFGNALSHRRDLEAATTAYQRAIEAAPGFAEAWNNLGSTLSALGRVTEAIAAYRQAIALRADYAEALSNLGNALRVPGEYAEAEQVTRQAIALQPDFVEAYNILGNVLTHLQRFDEAEATFQQAFQLRPRYAEAWNNLGIALGQQNRIEEAIAAYRQASECDPQLAQAHNNLATALAGQGRIDEAIPVFRHALAVAPDYADVHSNLVFNLHYLAGFDAAELVAEHRRWNEAHAAPLHRFIVPHSNDPSPTRPLRVGYVSADFRDHVVGRTLLPCFEAHDRSQFELFCYSGTAPVDPVGHRFRELATAWRLSAPLSDEALAAQIRHDRIDLLVDLALHTAHHRLLVFACKPAPIQLSWLGYPGPAGVDAIDLYLTDPQLSPPDDAVPQPVGEPLWLPESWCSYAPPAGSPEPGLLPAITRGQVTFGSFNNFAKINAEVLVVWAKILHRVEGSRLLLLSKGGPIAAVLQQFEQAGIAPGRVEFLEYYLKPGAGSAPPESFAYLTRYRQIDIALDPFPYNGMTTTCDALWMGIPVVALVGDRPISRASFSLLSNAGLPEFAATSAEDYVEVAARLAGDLPRLASLRADLRTRLQRSPLLDSARLTRHVEAAYRRIWERWCSSTAIR